MTQKQSDRPSTAPIYGCVRLKEEFCIEKFLTVERDLHKLNDDSFKLVELVMQMLKKTDSNPDSNPELIFSLVSLLHRLTLDEKAAQKFIDSKGIETLVVYLFPQNDEHSNF